MEILGITINDYMNLKGIDGTRIIATKDIQRILQYNYDDIKQKVQLLYVGDVSDGVRRVILNIPSESCGTDMYYTTVLDIYTNGEKEVKGNMFIKFFSNSPNFMFTYAFVYNQHNLIVEDYKKYLNRKSLTDKPKIRNPKQLLGIEKSIAYSILYIREVLRYKISYNTGREPRVIPSSDMIVQRHAKLKKEGKCKTEGPKQFNF